MSVKVFVGSFRAFLRCKEGLSFLIFSVEPAFFRIKSVKIESKWHLLWCLIIKF